MERLHQCSTSGVIEKKGEPSSWHVAKVVGVFETRSMAPQWGDQCLVPFQRAVFDRVVTLELKGREFDDRILGELETLTSLRQLTLNRTGISANGLRRWRDGLPPCTEIEFIDSRDVDVRVPSHGEIRWLSAEGTLVR